jgi:hypothetical protein
MGELFSDKSPIIDEMEMDIDNSVSNRDIETEKRLYKKLYKAWIKSYLDRMSELQQESDFVRDDTYNGVLSKHHIAYKLKCDDEGNTCLVSADGHRGYEFLIEFDVKDASYGIYYGCRALILDGDQEEEISILTQEWNVIKEEVRAVLNNTFKNINFLPQRFQPTNNPNNRTFWTFWITLYPEEDIRKVGALATKLIYGVYRNYILSGECGPYNTRAKRAVDTSKTRYTDAAYRQVLKEIGNSEKIEQFEFFLARATSEDVNLLEVDSRYQRCWRVKELSNDEFAFVVAQLCEKIELFTEEGGKRSDTTDRKNPRWSCFVPIIISSSCGPLDDIRKSYSRFFEDDTKRVEDKLDYQDRAENIIDQIFATQE